MKQFFDKLKSKFFKTPKPKTEFTDFSTTVIFTDLSGPEAVSTEYRTPKYANPTIQTVSQIENVPEDVLKRLDLFMCHCSETVTAEQIIYLFPKVSKDKIKSLLEYPIIKPNGSVGIQRNEHIDLLQLLREYYCKTDIPLPHDQSFVKRFQ